MKIEGISFIYKITSPSNKIYIGQTNNWQRRFREYLNLDSDKQTYLYRSINKYGWENHKIELIAITTTEEIDNLEIYYIKVFNSYVGDNRDFGLNLTRGGKGNNDLILTKEQLKSRSNRFIAMNKSEIGSKRTIETHSIPILQYTLDGLFIREWESATIAVKELNFANSSIGNIRNCVKGLKNYPHANGFIWKDKVSNFPLKIEKAKFNSYMTHSYFKVTNLKDNSETIVKGTREVIEKFNLNPTIITAALKYQDGIMKRKSLKLEILGFSLTSTQPSNI